MSSATIRKIANGFIVSAMSPPSPGSASNGERFFPTLGEVSAYLAELFG
jgi:hypothetical protein